MKRIFLVMALVGCSVASMAQKKPRRDYLVKLETNFGTMHLVLFDETPLHKANFVRLVKSKFYDGLLFHRIIEDFMIQGGDPTSRNATADARLGSGGEEVPRVPFEFTPQHIHTKGALAAARDNNPEKKSSGCQFYIVDGKPRQDEELTMLAQKNKMNYTTQQRADYMVIGGTPHLDNNYTVFGRVIDNLPLIDTLSSQARNSHDRPLRDLTMKMTVRKMSKKRITKKFGYQF